AIGLTVREWQVVAPASELVPLLGDCPEAFPPRLLREGAGVDPALAARPARPGEAPLHPPYHPARSRGRRPPRPAPPPPPAPPPLGRPRRRMLISPPAPGRPQGGNPEMGGVPGWAFLPALLLPRGAFPQPLKPPPAVAVEAEDFTVQKGWKVVKNGHGNYMVD